MNVISFFSFKGGVGRSNALLNTAFLLAKRGSFVIVADMDLLAPGLTLLPELAVSPRDKARRKKGLRLGLIDFLGAALESDGETSSPRFNLASMLHRPCMLDDLGEKEGFRGDLLFLPCGDLTTQENYERYHNILRHLPMHRLRAIQSQGKVGVLLEEMRKLLGKARSDRLPDREPDYLLLDARTGFTEISDTVISPQSDHLVLLFGLNAQNRISIEFILKELIQHDTDYPINNLPSRISLVVTPVPDSEEVVKAQALGWIQNMLDGVARPDPTRGNAKEWMPKLMQIPYHPLLALSESVIARDHPDSRPAKVYDQLAERLETLFRKSTRQVIIEAGVRAPAAVAGFLPEEEKRRKPPASSGGMRGLQRHPLTTTIPWNLLCPDQDWRALLKASSSEPLPIDPDLFLTLLATSISLEKQEKGAILDRFNELSAYQLSELVKIFQEERTKFLGLPPHHWEELAAQLGKHWHHWLTLLQERGALPGGERALALLETPRVAEGLRDPGGVASFWSGWANPIPQEQAKEEILLLRFAVTRHPDSSPLWRSLGNALQYDDHPNEAEQALQQAVSLARSGDAPADLAEALRVWAIVLSRLDKLQEASTALNEARDLFAADSNQRGVADCLHRLGAVHLSNSRLPEAEQCLTEARTIYETLNNRIGVANCLQSLGTVHLRNNRLPQAEQSLTEARTIYEAILNRLGVAHCLQSLGDLHLRNSRLPQAEQSLTEARTIYEAIHDRLGVANCLNYLGEIHLRNSRLPEAEQSLTEARASSESIGYPLGVANAERAKAEVLTARGEWEEAAALLEKVLGDYEVLQAQEGWNEALRAKGRLALAQGRPGEARQALLEALENTRRIGLLTLAQELENELKSLDPTAPPAT